MALCLHWDGFHAVLQNCQRKQGFITERRTSPAD